MHPVDGRIVGDEMALLAGNDEGRRGVGEFCDVKVVKGSLGVVHGRQGLKELDFEGVVPILELDHE